MWQALFYRYCTFVWSPSVLLATQYAPADKRGCQTEDCFQRCSHKNSFSCYLLVVRLAGWLADQQAVWLLSSGWPLYVLIDDAAVAVAVTIQWAPLFFQCQPERPNKWFSTKRNCCCSIVVSMSAQCCWCPCWVERIGSCPKSRWCETLTWMLTACALVASLLSDNQHQQTLESNPRLNTLLPTHVDKKARP